MGDKKLSRKEFLVGAGGLIAGALTAGTLSGVFGLSEAKAGTPSLPWPWPRSGLDVDKVRIRAFEGYQKNGCCYGAAKALLDTLAETAGGPWNTIPPEMFVFGSGGAVHWGTLCGALNGCLPVMTLATGKEGVSKLGHELMGWYTVFPFPSATLDYLTPDYKNQVQTVSKSPLCHNSVSIWCAASGERVKSAARKARCAKLTGDVAARAAELLNQWYAGSFTPVFQLDPTTQECISCHVGKESLLDDAVGSMTCTECHHPVGPRPAMGSGHKAS
ncbi:MAG: C-GCAxxG-C-C family (seleno)protein [Bacillota bacterium]